MTLIIAGIVIIVIWLYVLWGREWLVAKFPGGRIQWWHEAIEDNLWASSRTFLVARSYQLAGWLLAAQTMLAAAGIDTVPFTDQLGNLVPEKYRPLAVAGFMIITGLAFVKLRKMTTKPVEAL